MSRAVGGGGDDPTSTMLPTTDGDGYGRCSMILEWEPGDAIYVVTNPELPGCQTHGETLEEAVKQGRDALESWLDPARDLGKPIPPPKYFALAAVAAEEAVPVARR